MVCPQHCCGPRPPRGGRRGDEDRSARGAWGRDCRGRRMDCLPELFGGGSKALKVEPASVDARGRDAKSRSDRSKRPTPGSNPAADPLAVVATAPSYPGQPPPPSDVVRSGLEARVSATGPNSDPQFAGNVASALAKIAASWSRGTTISFGEVRCFAAGCLVRIDYNPVTPQTSSPVVGRDSPDDPMAAISEHWSGPMAITPEELLDRSGHRQRTVLFVRPSIVASNNLSGGQ
jgi:hypothetical protein